MSITFYAPPPVPADEDERVAAVHASGLLDAQGHPRLAALVERVRLMFGTASAAVTILHDDRQTLIAGAGCRTGGYRRATSFCGHAILDDSGLMCVPDAMLDDRFAGNPHVIDDRVVRFYAAAVIRDADGHALGALCIFDPAPRRALSPAEAMRLTALADAVIDECRERPATPRQMRGSLAMTVPR